MLEQLVVYRVKLPIVTAGLVVLCARSARASDTTGALVVIPVACGAAGLTIGGIICAVLVSRRGGERSVWLSLPVYGIAGAALGLAFLFGAVSRNEDKVVSSFGRYDRYRGGMGACPVPLDFSATELKEFYGLISNRENAVLRSHEFAAALIHGANGLARVELNVYPALDMKTEYQAVNDEVHRQMDIVLQRHPESVNSAPH